MFTLIDNFVFNSKGIQLCHNRKVYKNSKFRCALSNCENFDLTNNVS